MPDYLSGDLAPSFSLLSFIVLGGRSIKDEDLRILKLIAEDRKTICIAFNYCNFHLKDGNVYTNFKIRIFDCNGPSLSLFIKVNKDRVS